VSAPIDTIRKEEDVAGPIFASARERARTLGVSYAGAVTPAEAWTLQQSGAARIVDIRTEPEWQFVGHVPDLPLVVWPRDGDEDDLRQFLARIEAEFPRGEPILFLCRSGVRSHYAAELAAHVGYAHAYNVLEGFEGNGPGRGWRAAGLPWKKS
jgi:rhodanese-related sulfurtransferase